MSALRALHGNFDALPHSRRLRRRDGSQAFILRLLTGLASFWLVLQTLVVKKGLLSRRPDEILITVYTLDCSVRMLDFGACCHLNNLFPF